MNDNLNLHGMINKKIFRPKNFLISKFHFNELEQFLSSSSSEKYLLSLTKQQSFFEVKFKFEFRALNYVAIYNDDLVM